MLDLIEGQVNHEAIPCENCQEVSKDNPKFCPQCSFPNGGTEDEKRSFRLTVSSRKRLLSDAEDKIKGAKNIIYIIAGLTFLMGLYMGLGLDDFASMVVNFILCLIYLIMAAWSNKNPFGAILTAFIIYITIHVINAFFDPTTLIQGIILKIVFIGGFIKGIRSAQEAQGFMKELEKFKASPVGTY